VEVTVMAKAGKSKRPEETGEIISPQEIETTDAGAHSSPTIEQIQQRAYELYLERGGAEGNDIEDWLQAERELGPTGEGQDISQDIS
jgi:hypothetical protein